LCDLDPVVLGFEVEDKLVAVMEIELFYDVRHAPNAEHPFNLNRHFLIEDYCHLQSNGKTLTHGRIKNFIVNPIYVTQFGWMAKVCLHEPY
jgi:hypothetical protein